MSSGGSCLVDIHGKIRRNSVWSPVPVPLCCHFQETFDVKFLASLSLRERTPLRGIYFAKLRCCATNNPKNGGSNCFGCISNFSTDLTTVSFPPDPPQSTRKLLLGIWSHLSSRRRIQLGLLLVVMLAGGGRSCFRWERFPFLAVLSDPERLCGNR